MLIRIQSEPATNDDLSELLYRNEETTYYKLKVSDNGIGFDNKLSQEIFKVFKRLHSYQEYEGTGVGLSICKKIIEKHGGTIRAESELNEGATFTILLPEKQRRDQESTIPASTQSA